MQCSGQTRRSSNERKGIDREEKANLRFVVREVFDESIVVRGYVSVTLESLSQQKLLSVPLRHSHSIENGWTRLGEGTKGDARFVH